MVKYCAKIIALNVYSLLLALCYKISHDGVIKYPYMFKLSSILYPTTVCCITGGFTSILTVLIWLSHPCKCAANTSPHPCRFSV